VKIDPVPSAARAWRWQALAWLLTGVLAGSFVLRAALHHGPFWTDGWSAYLIGLTPLWLGAVAQALVRRRAGRPSHLDGTMLTAPDGAVTDLARAQVRVMATTSSSDRLWVRLLVSGTAIELTDPVTGILREGSELTRLAEALRLTGSPAHAPIAERLGQLADRGLVAAFEPAEPEPAPAAPPTGRARRGARLFTAGWRIYLGAVILLGVPYYLARSFLDSRSGGGPTGEQLLGWAGVALLFGTAAAYLTRRAIRDAVGARPAVGRRSLGEHDCHLIVIGGDEVPGTRLAIRWRLRPALLIRGRWDRLLDLADRASAQLLPPAELSSLAEAIVASARPGAAATARQVRELAAWRGVRPAGWLSGATSAAGGRSAAEPAIKRPESRGTDPGAAAQWHPEIQAQLDELRNALRRDEDR